MSGGEQMTCRFIHTADLHLDSPFKGLSQLPDAIRQRVIQSTFKAFENIVHYALAEKVDFIVIAGDVYDGAERSLRAQLHLKKLVESLAEAEIHVYIVHGNHDPLDGSRLPIEWPDNVHFFNSKEVTRLPFLKNGQEVASIYGISYATATESNNLAQLFKKDTQAYAIGLLHTNCEGALEHENYAPCTRADLVQANMDYWALGHVHTRKVIQEQPLIVYPGNSQGRHIREQGERGFYLVEVDEQKQTKLTFKQACDIIWIEKEIDISDLSDFSHLVQILDEERLNLSRTYSHQSLMVRLIIVGQTHLAEQLHYAHIMADLEHEWRSHEAHKQTFVWLESLHFQGSPAYEREELKASEGVYGDALHYIDTWLEDDEQRKHVLQDALQDLFRHHRAQKYLQPLTVEEETEMIKGAESLLFSEWLGGKQK